MKARKESKGVIEARKWKAASARRTAGMTPEEVVAYINGASERLRAGLRRSRKPMLQLAH